MTQNYECEVRFFPSSYDHFIKHLEGLKAKIKQRYAFTDQYYQPKQGFWDPAHKSLRLRRWSTPEMKDELLITSTEHREYNGLTFKYANLSEGKARIAKNKEDALHIIDLLEFTPWLTVQKERAALWEHPKFVVAIEYIRPLGWCCELEVEGEDLDLASEKLKMMIARLGITKYTHLSVAELVHKTRKE